MIDSDMVNRTNMLRSARSSVDERPIRVTCGRDQQIIHSSVNGVLGASNKAEDWKLGDILDNTVTLLSNVIH